MKTLAGRLTVLVVVFLGAVTSFWASAGKAAQPPQWLNYQGRLTTPQGVPVGDNSYQVVFRLYDVATGGSALWTETASVSTRAGVFNSTLGKTSELPPSLFTKRLWLEIEVAGRTLQPRQELGSVAFAMTALTMPDGSVTTAMIADLSVTTAKLADGAVTTAKLADGSVITVKLADGSVLEAKIADGAITSAKVAEGAITNGKIADGAVTAAKVADGAIATAKLADHAVNSAKLASDAGSLPKVSAGAMYINNNSVDLIDRAIGRAHEEKFAFNGALLSRYGLQWLVDNQVPGAPVAQLSGWAGIRLFTNDQPRLSIYSWGTVVAHAGMEIYGSLIKPGGSFKIDHPLDPTGQYLYHSFVESPDMKNLYDGVVKLDGAGQATVVMPKWFEALNQDFRYQLTSIGMPNPGLYVAQQVQGNSFRIAGGAPGSLVSWQVTGTRHDPWAEQHRIPVEVPKTGSARGRYMYPEAYGKPQAESELAVRGGSK